MASEQGKAFKSQGDDGSFRLTNMHSSTDLPLETPIPRPRARAPEALVQDRPTLGSLPATKRGASWWLLPIIDLVASSAAVSVIAVAQGIGVFPALPIAPMLLVAVYLTLGVYATRADASLVDGGNGAGWPVIRLLVAALFAW